jgi:sugar transferase (PEP-CTERM/EpsH1 system associated)
MPPLLFLTQRIPYPPVKGEKIRALQILNHLCTNYDVHLGTLVDDPADEEHVGIVEELCVTSYFARLDRRRAKLACLTGLLTREALSVTFYRDRGLASWVRRTIDTVQPEVVFIYSSNMAPYVLGRLGSERVSICDLVDVDSEKWRSYSEKGQGAMRWVHQREWHQIAKLEARIVREFDWSTLVTREEAALLQRQFPAFAKKIHAVPNGVDFLYFDPSLSHEPPYSTDRMNFVFTGTMDYPPNVDAVCWFTDEILPIIRRAAPEAQFHIVGSNPTPEVRALVSNPAVFVTGRVPDVRPYVAYATAAVAPMRIARGIQNKVLEAMAMGRPVVVTPDALEGIDARPDYELLLADSAEEFATRCLQTAEPGAAAIGLAARQLVQRDFSWDWRLRGFDALLRTGVSNAQYQTE